MDGDTLEEVRIKIVRDQILFFDKARFYFSIKR